MDSQTFDNVAKLFASRRATGAKAVAGVAALAVAGRALEGEAATVSQQAGEPAHPTYWQGDPDGAGSLHVLLGQTPDVAAAGTPGPVSDKEVMYLFVQSFENGSLVPKPDTPGRFILTLNHGLGETIYFSDRPAKVFGSVPTPQFLEALGFTPENPPNAALIGHRDANHKDIVVVELFGPTYDTSTNTATYEVTLLDDWRKLDETFEQTPDDEQHLPREFTAAHLFIDDCPDLWYTCYNGTSDLSHKIKVGTCWGWFPLPNCYPCEDYNYRCFAEFPDFCNSNSSCVVQICGMPGAYC